MFSRDVYRFIKEYHSLLWENENIEGLQDFFTDDVRLIFKFGTSENFECQGKQQLFDKFKTLDEKIIRTSTNVVEYRFKKLGFLKCRIEYTIDQHNRADDPSRRNIEYRKQYEENIILKISNNKFLIQNIDMVKLSEVEIPF